MSLKPSASQWLRPSTACCRHGPGSPAASARIQPVLRRSGPSRPSTKAAAEAATLGCANDGRIRALTPLSSPDQSPNTCSTKAPDIAAPPLQARTDGDAQVQL